MGIKGGKNRPKKRQMMTKKRKKKKGTACSDTRRFNVAEGAPASLGQEIKMWAACSGSGWWGCEAVRYENTAVLIKTGNTNKTEFIKIMALNLQQ